MNVGKIFENQFKLSVPNTVMFHRLVDPPQSFNQSDSLRFSWKNPCDVFLWYGETRVFYTLELKTTKDKSFSFEKEKKTNKTAKIHYHQIKSLTDFSGYPNLVSGFIFNFRDEKNETERTYFQCIKNFNKMIEGINKKSFNESDLLQYSPVVIESIKKRTRFIYNIEQFLEDTKSI